MTPQCSSTLPETCTVSSKRDGDGGRTGLACPRHLLLSVSANNAGSRRRAVFPVTSLPTPPLTVSQYRRFESFASGTRVRSSTYSIWTVVGGLLFDAVATSNLVPSFFLSNSMTCRAHTDRILTVCPTPPKTTSICEYRCTVRPPCLLPLSAI